MLNGCCDTSRCIATRASNQWKSLPNLLAHGGKMNLSEKGGLLQTVSSNVPERSKSMDFVFQYCELEAGLMEEDDALEYSAYDIYLSKDFTDLMNASLSERSDIDSNDVEAELDDSFDCWREMQSNELTEENLSRCFASRMYSNENLDRIGKNLYKIKKWFQRCNADVDAKNNAAD